MQNLEAFLQQLYGSLDDADDSSPNTTLTNQSTNDSALDISYNYVSSPGKPQPAASKTLASDANKENMLVTERQRELSVIAHSSPNENEASQAIENSASKLRKSGEELSCEASTAQSLINSVPNNRISGRNPVRNIDTEAKMEIASPEPFINDAGGDSCENSSRNADALDSPARQQISDVDPLTAASWSSDTDVFTDSPFQFLTDDEDDIPLLPVSNTEKNGSDSASAVELSVPTSIPKPVAFSTQSKMEKRKENVENVDSLVDGEISAVTKAIDSSLLATSSSHTQTQLTKFYNKTGDSQANNQSETSVTGENWCRGQIINEQVYTLLQ